MYNFLQPRTGAGRFLKLILAGLVLQVPLATAQFTQVMGTVVDPHGIPYANGTIFPNLIIQGSPRFTSSGFPYVPPSQPTGLDAHGSFIMSIADVTQLTPSGGVWSFTVNCGAGCVPPATGVGPVTFTTTGLIISGTVQDISSVLQLAAPPLTGGGGGGGGVSSINGATGTLTFPNFSCAAPNCSLTNPVIIPMATSSLSPLTGLNSSGFGTQFAVNCCPNSGVPSMWTTGSNVTGANWQPIPWISVNSLGPANVNNQNFVGVGVGGAPAPPANGISLTWARTGATGAALSRQDITAAIVGNGDVNSAFLGTGIFAPPIPGVSSNGTVVTHTIPLAFTSTTSASLQWPTFPTAAPAQITGTPQLVAFGTAPTANLAFSNGSSGLAGNFIKIATVPTVNTTLMNTSGFTLTGTAPNTCNATNFPANGRCIVFYTAGPNTGVIGAALVGDGNPANCFLGNGTVGPCDQGLTCTVVNDIPLSTTPATFCAVLLAVKTYTVHCAILYTLTPAGGVVDTGFDVDVVPTNTNPNFNGLLISGVGSTAAFATMLQSRIFQTGENGMISYQVTAATTGSFFGTIDGVIVVSAPTHFDVFTTFDTGTGSSIISGSYCRLQP